MENMERRGISKVKKSMNLETLPVESIHMTVSFLAVADTGVYRQQQKMQGGWDTNFSVCMTCNDLDH